MLNLGFVGLSAVGLGGVRALLKAGKAADKSFDILKEDYGFYCLDKPLYTFTFKNSSAFKARFDLAPLSSLPFLETCLFAICSFIKLSFGKMALISL